MDWKSKVRRGDFFTIDEIHWNARSGPSLDPVRFPVTLGHTLPRHPRVRVRARAIAPPRAPSARLGPSERAGGDPVQSSPWWGRDRGTADAGDRSQSSQTRPFGRGMRVRYPGWELGPKRPQTARRRRRNPTWP
jgi:hypothetical protein